VPLLIEPFVDYCRIRLADDPHLWASTLFDEVVELGFTGSYPSLTTAIRKLGLRPHCEPCHAAKGRDVAIIAHPAGEETLTRQNLPAVRTDYVAENLCRYGAYELAAAGGEAAVTIFATGSEVEIALAAKKLLDGKGHATRVVSVPAFELFEQQSDAYKAKILGTSKVKVAIEAAVRQGWDRFIGTDGIFIGMTGFGASGKIEDLYPHFGITAEATAKAVEERLKG